MLNNQTPGQSCVSLKDRLNLITHQKSDFVDVGIPTSPEEKLLWWYGDYVIYKFFSQVKTDYICIYEYDLFMGPDLLKAWEFIKIENIDAATCFIWEPDETWYWKSHSQEKYNRIYNPLESKIKVYATNFPFIIINRKAASFLLQRRLMQSKFGLTEGVYCEPFLASELKNAGFSIIGLNSIGIDTSSISTTIPISFNCETKFDRFKHPVLADQQFLPKAISCLKSTKERRSQDYDKIFKRIADTVISEEILQKLVEHRNG